MCGCSGMFPKELDLIPSKQGTEESCAPGAVSWAICAAAHSLRALP